jgi:diaminopropionate ammonia-lyase
MLGPHPFSLFANPRLGTPGITVLPAAGFRRAKAEITAWPGYAPTPLRDLPDLARQAGIGSLRMKDEAGRFGLGSFKALGGAYAVATLLCNELARAGIAPAAATGDLETGTYRAATEQVTVTCATDGNHGRAVAWGAQRFHAGCVIFIHATVSQGRADAIARYGAEIRRVPGTYDDAVRECARHAQAHNWHVVSDTSWPGYTEIPRDIMQGYRLMADEAADQWTGPPPTHVFIQGGVGGAAAAVSVQCRARFKPSPALIVVEPDHAACLRASAELGERTAIPGDLDTIMAGLACGEPSLLAWQELDRAAAAFMAIPDDAAVATLRLLAAQGIVAGESGVAGLAGCLLAAADPAARATLGLGAASRALLFNTEGATDPQLYAKLTGVSAVDRAGSRHG